MRFRKDKVEIKAEEDLNQASTDLIREWGKKRVKAHFYVRGQHDYPAH